MPQTSVYACLITSRVIPIMALLISGLIDHVLRAKLATGMAHKIIMENLHHGPMIFYTFSMLILDLIA